MKKSLILTAVAATLVSSTAFAAVPVTDMQADQNKVSFDYGFHNKLNPDAIDANMKLKNAYGVSFEHDFTDKDAVQLSFTNGKHTATDGFAKADSKENEGKNYEAFQFSNKITVKNVDLTYNHKFTENVNVYGGFDYLTASVTAGMKSQLFANSQPVKDSEHAVSHKVSEHKFGVKAGVVAHTKLGKNVTAFAKFGAGNVNRLSSQAGLTYNFGKNMETSVYYAYDKYKVNDVDYKVKGFHLNLGYKF